jgi:hypothetical protein
LDDGLLMIATHVLKIEEVKLALINVLDCDELPARIDFTKSVTNEDHRSLVALSRKHSIGYYFKLIISTFSGCSMEHQMPVLERYGYDVEVLVPAYTRLYCRWLNSTVIRGSLTDMPSIKNEQVIRH